jgi:hypothetical protein
VKESSSGAFSEFLSVRRISVKRFLVRITGQSHLSLPLVFEQVRFQSMGVAPNHLAIMIFQGVLQ